MKRLIAILLFIGIFYQTFSKLVILVDFKINQDYIAANLCENKNKPELHCHGKCHLRKRLAKDDAEQNAPSSKTKIEKFEITLFFEKQPIYCFQSFELPDIPKFYLFDETCSGTFKSEILRPPGMSSPTYLLS